MTPAPATEPVPARDDLQALDLGHRLGRIDGRLDAVIALLERAAVAAGSDGAP